MKTWQMVVVVVVVTLCTMWVWDRIEIRWIGETVVVPTRVSSIERTTVSPSVPSKVTTITRSSTPFRKLTAGEVADFRNRGGNCNKPSQPNAVMLIEKGEIVCTGTAL